MRASVCVPHHAAISRAKQTQPRSYARSTVHDRDQRRSFRCATHHPIQPNLTYFNLSPNLTQVNLSRSEFVLFNCASIAPESKRLEVHFLLLISPCAVVLFLLFSNRMSVCFQVPKVCACILPFSNRKQTYSEYTRQYIQDFTNDRTAISQERVLALEKEIQEQVKMRSGIIVFHLIFYSF